MRNLFAVSILLFLLSCGKKKTVPAGILEPQQMQSVFWDYIRADVYAKEILKKDISKNDTIENIKLQKKIFSHYNISKEDFYRSYNYYTAHSELMNVLIDSMMAKQNRRSKELRRPEKNATKSIYE